MVYVPAKDECSKRLSNVFEWDDDFLSSINNGDLEGAELDENLLDEVLDVLYSKSPKFEDVSSVILKLLK